jgi:metal transporter CNNM
MPIKPMALVLALVISIQIQSGSPSIVHIAPKDPDQVYQLNENSEFEFNRVTKHGWLVEANSKTKFIVILNLNRIDEAWVLYMYFTANSHNCDDFDSYNHIPIIIKNQTATRLYRSVVEVSLNHLPNSAYYLCLQNGELFEHQGTVDWLSVVTYKVHVPLPVKILIYITTVVFAAIFNGLNLGLMSLNIKELQLLMKTSDSLSERKYAENILPLRKNGNFLLCSILLSVTLSSSVSTLLLDNMTDGVLAGIVSTIILCIFSEILPQAICSKYSLPIGSYTRKFTYFFLVLMSPLAYPFSRLIDLILGKEVPAEYNRDKIKELIKNSKELVEDELQMISGALDFRNKAVSDIMIKLDDVFMLNDNVILDFNTMLYIYNSGYSRIPIYHESKENVIGWLHIKDLCLIDPQDNLPLYKLIHLFRHKVNYFHFDCKLDMIFETFRKGETHLAFVFCESSSLEVGVESNLHRKCIGIVTLHDVIEALVQFEINDEFEQNEKSKYSVLFLKQILSKYIEPGDLASNSRRCRLDPQLKLVIIQRLCCELFFRFH